MYDTQSSHSPPPLQEKVQLIFTPQSTYASLNHYSFPILYFFTNFSFNINASPFLKVLQMIFSKKYSYIIILNVTVQEPCNRAGRTGLHIGGAASCGAR